MSKNFRRNDCQKVTIQDILKMKQTGQKITMLTAYDFPLASFMDKAGIDIILVGDSVGMVVLGYESTLPVTMEEMLHHAKAVRRATKYALVVGDMPYESYQKDPSQAVYNAKRFIDEAGCDAVKLEWFDKCISVSEQIVKAKIPLMGHVGLTPQTADKLGGFKVQGKDAEQAKKILDSAINLEKVGCFSVVLECIPDRLAQIITEKLKIPTIGIGAGPYCDGQVLVTHDMLGLFERFVPRFAKQYVNLSKDMIAAFQIYIEEVRTGKFPTKEHSFTMKQEEADKLRD